MTLRDFFILYPDATVDIMTPGGYVRLDPQQIKGVLAGRDATGGIQGLWDHVTTTPAAELLSQSIHECDFGDGIYHITTGQEPVDAPSYFREKYGSAMMDGIAKRRLDENLASYRESLMNLPVPELISPEKVREMATFYDLYDSFKDMPQCDVVMEYEKPLSLMTGLMRFNPDEPVMSQEAFDAMWIPLCEDHGITDDEGYAKDPRFYDFEMRCMLPSQKQEQASRSPRTNTEVLREKLDAGYKAFEDDMLAKGGRAILENSAEVYANQLVYDELYGGSYPEEMLDYLLRYQNPLEVVRDQWMAEKSGADGDMWHVLWTVSDKQAAEADYELDPLYMPAEPDADQQMG